MEGVIIYLNKIWTNKSNDSYISLIILKLGVLIRPIEAYKICGRRKYRPVY